MDYMFCHGAASFFLYKSLSFLYSIGNLSSAPMPSLVRLMNCSPSWCSSEMRMTSEPMFSAICVSDFDLVLWSFLLRRSFSTAPRSRASFTFSSP